MKPTAMLHQMTKTTPQLFPKCKNYSPRSSYINPIPCPTLSTLFHNHECHPHSPMAILLSLSPPPPKPPQKPNPKTSKLLSFTIPKPSPLLNPSKRDFILKTSSLSTLLLILQYPFPHSHAEPSPPSKSILSGIASTKSWFQFFGDGFAIRVPPQFEDIMEPEDYNAGLSLYGDKAKTKTYAARFASPDGSEVLSVIIRPSTQLKITFLENFRFSDSASLDDATLIKDHPEANDISDLGSLKEAARLFIPGGATLYSARTIRIKEDEGFRTYYFYEFGRDEQHIALVAAVNRGKAFIAGAAAPQSKWAEDGVELRSAAISLTVL